MDIHPLQKRKRLTQNASGEDTPNTKKRRVSEFEMAVENHDLRILKKQRRMIQKKYNEQVKENEKLKDQLEHMESDRNAHSRLIAYIDQLWSTFANDVKLIGSRLALTKNYEKEPESSFLAEILSAYKTFSDNVIDNDMAKETLNAKMELTKTILTNFVEGWESLKSGAKQLQVEDIEKALNEAQLQVKKYQADYAKSTSDFALLQKKYSELEEKLEDYKAELSDANLKIENLKESLNEAQLEIENVKKKSQSELANSGLSDVGPLTDEHTKQVIEGLQTDVEHLRAVIKMKEEELVEKSKEQIQLIRDHNTRLNEASSQEAIEQTLPFKQLAEKCNLLTIRLDEYQKEIEEAHKRENQSELKLSTFRSEILRDTQSKLETLKSRVIERDNIIRGLKQELERSKEISERAKEVSEYEKQIKVLKSKLESKSKKLSRLREDIRECFSKEKNDLVYKIKFLGKQKKIADKKMSDMEAEIQNLRLRLQEAGSNPDQISVQELEKEIAELREFKQNLPEINQIKQIEELKAELEEQKTLCHEYEQELNELSNHCEELNMFKDRQADQIRRFEDAQVEFNLERAREKKRQTLHQQEKEKLMEQINLQKQLNEKLTQQLQQLQKTKAAQDENFSSIQKQYQLERTTVETQRHQQIEILNSITNEKSHRESLTNQLNVKSEELLLNQEKYAELEEHYKHMEDETERLKIRLQNAMSGVGSDELREELDEYKKMVTCSICQTNQKSILITKCHHAFCKACIDRQVASRSRKCPTCGCNYSPQSDLTNFYL